MMCFSFNYESFFFVDGSFVDETVWFFFFCLFFFYFFFLLTLFFFLLFVGWVAMVLTSSSCNLGIDNIDSRQVPNFTFQLKNLAILFYLFIYLIYLQFREPWFCS